MSGKTQIIVEQVKNESTSAIGKRLTKDGTLFLCDQHRGKLSAVLSD